LLNVVFCCVGVFFYYINLASQRSGSSLDEEFLGGVVIFVDTSSLRPAILALLQDPPLRRELEARGLKYMREDMTQTSVRREGEEPIPSSLALLTSALKNLGIMKFIFSLACGLVDTEYLV